MDLEFVVAAFSPDGNQVKAASRRVKKVLDEQKYKKMSSSRIVFPMNLELTPARYQLRLLVRDNRTGSVGRVDVPLILPPVTAKSR